MKKTVLLISFLVLLLLINGKMVLKSSRLGKRSVGHEQILMKLEFKGDCRIWAKMTEEITVSRLDECLPILSNGSEPNDLEAHYSCTQVRKDYSIIDVLEVFDPSGKKICF